ncbi:hypothetical protein [Pelagibacterium montanilacus]|uniref:hypothetical protein n=1 Tax=Pelagibacterium montanilacus TaxID=2185280 RepID=UPI000F8DC626|nr:hypothetical protein [Pelagibacterium montanilacus]
MKTSPAWVSGLALALAVGLAAAPAGAQQSAFIEYADLRAIERLNDFKCLHLRATDRIGLGILVDDAYLRADIEIDATAKEQAEHEDEEVWRYMILVENLETRAESRIPDTCDIGASALHQNIFTDASRFNLALFMLAIHFNGLDPADALHRPLAEGADAAMQTYADRLAATFRGYTETLREEATALAQTMFTSRTLDEIHGWIDKVTDAALTEEIMADAGYGVSAITYYGSDAIVLVEADGSLAVLGTEWPRTYKTADGRDVKAFVGMSPEGQLRLNVVDGTLSAGDFEAHLMLRTEPPPEGVDVFTLSSRDDWRDFTTGFGATALAAESCAVGPCYEVEPGFLERLAGEADQYELVFAPAGSSDLGAPQTENMRYTGPISTALDGVLARFADRM